MAKARVRSEQATVVELSASTRATVLDGLVLLQRGHESFTVGRREAEVLAAVVGTGEVPRAVQTFLDEQTGGAP